mgnify:FL=1
MSGEDKTPPKTLKEVVREQVTATPKPQVNEKNEGISSEDSKVETNAGEPIYESGIDISDIPEQERTRLVPLLKKKAKLLEDGYQKKFSEVASFKKAQDDLIKSGLSVEEARNVLSEYIEKKRNPATDTEKKKDAVHTLNKLMDGADYATKEQLQTLRQIILEETSADELRKEISELKRLVSEMAGETTETKRQRVNEHMNVLKEKYGNELIEKYADNFYDAHIRVGIPMPRLLQSIIPIEEIEQAILSKQRKPLTKEKKDAISSPASDVSSPIERIEKIETKGRTYRDVIKDLLVAKK